MAALALLSITAAGDPARAWQAPPGGQAAPAATLAVVDQSQLALFAVELDKLTLTESLTAYGDPADPLLPVGELSRLLDLAVTVRAQTGSITGRIGEAGRPLTVELTQPLARIGATDVALAAGDFAVSPIDIFIRASVLARLLPLRISVDVDDYRVTLQATEKLPIQSRKERRDRLISLGTAPRPEMDVLQIAAPYRWVGRPAFDLRSEVGYDNGRTGFVRRFEGRVAGDLLKTEFSGFLATDDVGTPAAARIAFEKRSAAGSLLGPLGASYVGVGDVFTPALPVGPRSFGGYGAAFSTARAQDASVFQRINLRGELPVGFDVELYINDTLYAGQNEATQGRYDFQNVPLTRGVNIIRLVIYGPRGEREEQTRVINVGGGQLATGQTVIEAGVVAQDRPLIEFPAGRLIGSLGAKGKPRLVGSIAHGVSPELTLAGGVGIFTDQFGGAHQILTGGARGSLLGASLQLDYSHDVQGGSAMALGVAGQLSGLSFLTRHIEYGGRFLDENILDFDPSRPLTRHSEVFVDFGVPFLAGQRLPLSARVERNQFADGGLNWSARGRTSLLVARTLVAVGVDYASQQIGGLRQQRFSSNFSLSRLIGTAWQLRAASDVDILPSANLRSLSATADRALSDQASLRFGLAKAFGIVQDLSVQAGLLARLKFGEAALSGDYSTDQKRWRIGLQLNFGFAHDPARGGYRLTPPGPASGGSAAVLAFADGNGNGRMDPGEDAMPGISFAGGQRGVTTDARGRAFVTGLGNGRPAMLRADNGEVDTLFTVAPPQNIALNPRAGSVAYIPYAFSPASEVIVRARFRKPDGTLAGLAAVRLRLVEDGGKVIESSTEFDGTAVFEAVRPGHYRLEIDAEQAQRIGIALREAVVFSVDLKGRQIDVNGEIILVQRAAP